MSRHRRLQPVLTGLLTVALLTGCTAAEPGPVAPGSSSVTTSARAVAPTTIPTRTPSPPALPDGSRAVFPGHRLVGFSGAPGSTALGDLTGDLDAAAEQLVAQAVPYATDRPVLPVFELIATVADAVPGDDGDYSRIAPDAEIQEYLDAARGHGALLLLNIQPGRADFLPSVQAYEKWLTQPDVGVALDPEWAVGPGQVPGETYGQTTGSELDQVAAYLSGLVTAGDLPQKVLVYHQVAPRVVRDEAALTDHPGVAVVKSVDGIGSAGAKTSTWNLVNQTLLPFVHPGFKLFFTEDSEEGVLMTPEQVLALTPTPEYILYE